MSHKEPKQCPACGGMFLQRKNGCCPYCDFVLIKHKEEVIEVGSSSKILKAFLDRQDEPIDLPKGSSAYIAELGIAKRLLESTHRYLNLVGDTSTDRVDFLIRCIKYCFESKQYVNWAIRATSLSCFGGKVLSGVQPLVLREQEKTKKVQRVDFMAATSTQAVAGMLQMG